jgi:outer membrane protein TolC
MNRFATARLLYVLASTLALAGCQSVVPSAHLTAPTPSDEPIGQPRLGLPIVCATPDQKRIGLCDALALADVANPTIALAEEAIRASEALQVQANALLLPTLDAGTNVRLHQGTLLSSTGIVRDVNLQSVYFGAGAAAVGTGTVNVPGVRLVAHLGDAYFAPQAARQQVIARRFDAAAIRNATLLDVGSAYLALVAAHGELQALRRSEEDVGTIVEMTANFAKTGQGRESDAQRARAQWLLIDGQAQAAQERIAAAAADLARLLDLDPSVPLVPADPVPPILELVDPTAPLPELVQVALANRPELGARSAEVATAHIHRRQEHVRPWLPVLMAGLSLADFGGDGNQTTSRVWLTGERIDIDVAAVWSLQNAGLGNRAWQNRAQAEIGAAEAQRQRVADRVRTEVAEALALVVGRRREIDITRRRVETAQQAFEEDLRRTRNLVGLPIEVLRSLDLLTTARLDLVRAMAGYSEAQLQLYAALGDTPICAHDTSHDSAARALP